MEPKKSKQENLKIRKMGPDDLEQYNDLLRYAFQVTEKQLLDLGWEDDDIRQSKFPILEKAGVLGFFDGNKLASQFAVYPLKMNIYGRVYDIGFVTGVATYPEYTGMGLISRLMKQGLEEMRKNRQTISLLYPYSIPFYRHKGWEIISDKMTFQIKDSQLPKKLAVPGYVRRVDTDSRELFALHNRFAEKTHGCIFRNDLAWEEYWRWDVDDISVAIYYSQEDVPLGYMVYLLKEDMMYIKELVYINLEAWRGLWKYISAHESMINGVNGSNYSGEAVAFWLEDSEIKETIRPYIMGRIIDVEKFLEGYNFNDISRQASLSFLVEDPLLEWNNGTFTLEFSSSGPPVISREPAIYRDPEISRKISQKPDSHMVKLNIAALTTLLLGYKLPSNLHAMERLDCPRETLSLLEKVVPRGKAYISDYI